MSERLRFVGSMDRVLYLRTLSELDGVPAAELAQFAEYGRERSFRPGEILLEEGELPSSFFVVARGTVEVSSEGLILGHAKEREPVGLIALLSDDRNGIRARAAEEVLCLEFSSETLKDALEERFSIVQNLLRNSARQCMELWGQVDPRRTPGEHPSLLCPTRPLDLVERIALLRNAHPFQEVGLDSLAALARQLEERRWDRGEEILSAGERGDRIEILVCGSVDCHDRVRDIRFRREEGAALGVLEAYAGRPRAYSAVAAEHVVSLGTHAGAMVDLMEDHLDIAMSSLATMGRLILRYGRMLALSRAS